MQTRSSKQRMVLRSGLVLKPLSPKSRKLQARSPRLPRSILLKSLVFAATPQKSTRQVSFAPITPSKLVGFATPPTKQPAPEGYCTICRNFTCKLRASTPSFSFSPPSASSLMAPSPVPV